MNIITNIQGLHIIQAQPRSGITRQILYVHLSDNILTILYHYRMHANLWCLMEKNYLLLYRLMMIQTKGQIK